MHKMMKNLKTCEKSKWCSVLRIEFSLKIYLLKGYGHIKPMTEFLWEKVENECQRY